MGSVWPTVPLGSVLTERRETPEERALAAGDIKIVSKIGFNDGIVSLRSGADTKTGMILVRPGDLLVSGINAAKGAIAVYGEENASPIAATIHYGAYTPDPTRVTVQYLWWLLRSRVFRDLLSRYVPGGIKTELKAKRLLPIPIPLPELAEQQRIVSRIEELAGRIEEARTLRRQTQAGVEALMASHITGALHSAPANGTLQDIMVNKPRNGWSARCDNSEMGVPVLSLSAVTGFRYRDTAFKRTSEPTKPDAHYWLRPGDLLMTRSNSPELVGHAAIYTGSPFPCIYPDLIMRLCPDSRLADTRFVHYWLQSIAVRDYIKRTAKGTSPTMKKISQSTVMKIPFPTGLSLGEQHSIVAHLDYIQGRMDALKQLQAQTWSELEALLPSILYRDFNGNP